MNFYLVTRCAVGYEVCDQRTGELHTVTTSKGRVGPCSCQAGNRDSQLAGRIHQSAVRRHLLDTRFKPVFHRQAAMRAVPNPDPKKRTNEEIFPEDPNFEIFALAPDRYEVRDLTKPEAFVIDVGARMFVGPCSCGDPGNPPFFYCRHRLALKAHLVRLPFTRYPQNQWYRLAKSS